MYQQEVAAPNREDIEKERWIFWQGQSRDWRVSAAVLPQKLEADFTSPEIRASFKRVDDNAFLLGLDIKELKSDVDESHWNIVESPEFQQRTEALLETIEGLRKNMESLIILMEKDVQGQWLWPARGPGRWPVLWH